MDTDFLHTTLGRTGFKVHRLGLSATYRPGKKTIYKALDEGLNYFFMFGFDGQMTGVMREVLREKRKELLIASGSYNLIWGHTSPRKSLEKRLRKLGTDYIDIFLHLGVVKEQDFPDKLCEELIALRNEGKVRAIGISTHVRKFAGRLASEGNLDLLMIRYNAAHRGAEQDIFPFLSTHNPGIVSFTATRWRHLLRRPKGRPKNERIPTAGECYRFVLSSPHVHICMVAPTNIRQFNQNLKEIRRGPLSDEDLDFICRFGDRVHHQKKWFM